MKDEIYWQKQRANRLIMEFWEANQQKHHAIKRKRPNKEIIFYQDLEEKIATQHFNITGKPIPENKPLQT